MLQPLKPVQSRARVSQEKPSQWGARAAQRKSDPSSLYPEKSLCTKEDPRQPKLINKFKKHWISEVKVIKGLTHNYNSKAAATILFTVFLCKGITSTTLRIWQEGNATHSGTLAWKIPWEEPGRLQSMGSLKVWHDWAASLPCIGEGNGNPLQCSCLENPRDRGAGGLPSMGSNRVGHDWSNLAQALNLHLTLCLEKYFKFKITDLRIFK